MTAYQISKKSNKQDESTYNSKTSVAQYRTNKVTKKSTGVGKTTHTINNNAAKQTKLAKMLTNEHVKRWHDNLARGSPLTAEVRVRRLGAFCSQYKMRPGQIIDKAGKDIRAVSDMLEDHVTYMESKNYSPTYILDYVKAIKSWLRHFDIEIKRKIKVSNSHKTPTLEGLYTRLMHKLTLFVGRYGLKMSGSAVHVVSVIWCYYWRILIYGFYTYLIYRLICASILLMPRCFTDM